MSISLSQGLRQVKKMKGKLAELMARGAASVFYQTDNRPAFDFNAVLSEETELRNKLVVLETKIATTNVLTMIEVDAGETRVSLAQAIRTLQELKSRIAWIKTLSTTPREKSVKEDVIYDAGGHSTRKIEYTCDLTEAKRVELIDSLQNAFDKINDRVESANHSTQLSE